MPAIKRVPKVSLSSNGYIIECCDCVMVVYPPPCVADVEDEAWAGVASLLGDRLPGEEGGMAWGAAPQSLASSPWGWEGLEGEGLSLAFSLDRGTVDASLEHHAAWGRGEREGSFSTLICRLNIFFILYICLEKH